MPIYEYRCTICGKTFELRQSFKDEPIKIHPKNESGSLCLGVVERVIPRSSFHLKGAGWAKDGYSRPTGKTAK